MWDPCLECLSHDIEMIQNKPVRFISNNIKGRESVTEAREKLSSWHPCCCQQTKEDKTQQSSTEDPIQWRTSSPAGEWMTMTTGLIKVTIPRPDLSALIPL